MLTYAHRQHIMTSINELEQQNAVHKLIYAITKHFIGDPIIIQERSLEILQNLRCRILSDFRWYHNVFLSRAFTENVQNTLREK